MLKLPSRSVASRYNVTIRTVDRWSRDPELGFPKATQINGRNYFDVRELDDFDRRRAEAREAVAS